MKNIRFILVLTIMITAGFIQSCEKNQEAKGKLDFSLDLSEESLKSASEIDSLSLDSLDTDISNWHLIVSIESEDGSVVIENKIIDLIIFGSGFFSESIELEVGNYLLTQFLVVSPAGEVVYAAPIEGSPKAYLVMNPLPLEFSISEGETSRVIPEVLYVGNSSPGDFGYATFSFTPVYPIRAYVVVIDDNPFLDRPSICIPATMILSTRDGWTHEYDLTAGVNKILVRSGYDIYEVIIKNPDYPVYEGTITARELWNSTEDNPVVFNLYENSLFKLELQPGPDEGMDAMITDLDGNVNFGDHPLFEASFLTEPILTVMRSKRSLIDFDLNNLPKSATIRKVTLTLALEGFFTDSIVPLNTDDVITNQQMVLRQIVEPWEEYKVTWENQPNTIVANQVFIPLFEVSNSIYQTYDVTSLFVPYQEVAAPNYGMMLLVAGDNPYPCYKSFASSDHPDKSMRPKLTIYYSLP